MRGTVLYRASSFSLLLDALTVSYWMHLLIGVQLLHSVQAFPDSSDKLGPISLTFQTKQHPIWLSSKKMWQIKLSNRSTSSKLRKTFFILEVILQSTFSRTVVPLSKQKRVNAYGHNSTTRYFDDETSGALYS